MFLTRAALVILVVIAAALPAKAQRSTTQDALSRMQEALLTREEDGIFSRRSIQPIMVVSTVPAFEETRNWYPNAALGAIVRTFGAAAVRSCEACMAPRTNVVNGRLEQSIAALTIEDIIRIDSQTRGTAPPAKSAVWLDETMSGVSIRIIELSTSRVIFADNFDPMLDETLRSEINLRNTRELDRRRRGDSLTHLFVDAIVYPGQHVTADWTEQWGDDNNNLSGVTLSFWRPLIGVGACYYRIIPQALNLSVGAQLIVSVPTGLVNAVSPDGDQELVDGIITGAVMARLPIANSNFALLLGASFDGSHPEFGVGLSLMNISFLPVLP